MPAHLYLLFLLIFSPPSQQSAANNSDLCQMASREGSFGGRLTSLTWEVTSKSETPSAQQQHNLLIMVDTTGYRVPRRSISRLSMTPAVENNLYSINSAHLKTFLALVAGDSARSSSSRPNSSGPLIGYSTFRVSHHGDPSRDKLVAYFQATDLFLRIDFSSNRRAETVYKRQGVPANFALIHDDSLRSADEQQEEEKKAGAGAKDKEENEEKASHRRPSLYAFGIDGADGDDSYRFFPVALSSSRNSAAVQREDDQLPLEMASKLDSTFFGSYYPYLEGGHLHLTPVMPYKRNKGRPPASRRSFASLPRGTVVFETGVLYLLDDALGCVYSVEGWHRLDLHASRKIGGGAATMKFKATGTPYERFFVCSSAGEEAVTPNARRRPDRCDISARGSSLLAALRQSWPWLLVGCLFLTLLLVIGWFELQWWTARRGSDSGGGGFPFSFSAKKRKGKGGSFLNSMSIAKDVSADDRFSGISVSKTGPAAVVASISPFKKVKDFQQAVARMANKTKQNSAKQVKSKIKSKVGSKIQSKVASSPVASSLSPKQSSKSKTPLPPDTGDRLRRLLDI